MPSFQYGNTALEYSLEVKPDKRDISISVEWLDGVRVIVPEGVEEDQLHSILYKKAPWILNKWNSFQEIVDPPLPKEYVSGEKFAYLGRNYRLKVHKRDDITQSTLVFKQGKFIANVPSSYADQEKNHELYELFKEWYKLHGEAKIKERLNIYCPKMGLSPSKIELKEQKMRWGTCTGDNAIYLNWRIVMAPLVIVDYLLVHELAHIKYPNHSKEYWQLVHSIMPDYEQRKEWLRINGPTLSL
ncbi:zinc metalloprotease [Anaerobacillus alkalidiazotrophicus]|uniref:Zinc metalloprotease n=1 Tax=Anaerobacillus alkalidiazotrophicus TaxID=472963 RepID=A0A1S2MBU4_9BACI|nr:SprT family zinc-dependent metalloprotease [Anaerobacillus alkalidiazotrophicus]OIJ22024.1 zinc metalloprotease [Anaerobacillus alkalidiazotrophicus]